MAGWDKINNRIPRFDDCAARLKDSLEKGTLARAIKKLPKLGSLIVNLNQHWRDDEQGDWDDSQTPQQTNQSNIACCI
jgi:hypothetical protein